MAGSAKPQLLSGEEIVARTPRVLDYLATLIDNAANYGADTSLEAPADLPMDEATFCAVLFVCLEFADAAQVTPAELRERAAQFRANLGGV